MDHGQVRDWSLPGHPRRPGHGSWRGRRWRYDAHPRGGADQLAARGHNHHPDRASERRKPGREGLRAAHDRAIDGARITLNAALSTLPNNTSPFTGQVFTAEVLNLTRNVVIGGAPGAAHTSSSAALQPPHSIRYAVLQHMGPNNADQSLLGRYPLHFHHSGDGSRGSLVEGVVVRQSGLAPRSCRMAPTASPSAIAHDWSMAAYWWDEGTEHQSHDILFDRAVAHFAPRR